jgi:hypothetical protein
MLKALFGTKEKQITSTEKPGQLAGVQSGITASAIDNILLTGQSDKNISHTFGDALPGIPMMTGNQAFTQKQATALKEVSTQLTVMADATEEAATHLEEINKNKVRVKKAVGKVHRSNMVTTSAIQGVDTQTANLAEKQRLNHNNNALSYYETQASIQAQIDGKMAGYFG